MQKRSLATYLNAFTSADATTYPFATQNVQDYYNLMAVYLDAMYFPSLHELDFMQEGHRLELVTEEEDAAERAAEGTASN
jgi:Zn-dependent M16 (insulinase) family peptidase